MPSSELVAMLVKYGLFQPAQIVVVLTALALLFGFRVKAWWAWSVTVGGFLAFVLNICTHWPNGVDTEVFWHGGADALAGLDPYQRIKLLTPPTGLGLFSLLGRFDFPHALAIWTIINFAGMAVLVIAARAALRMPGSKEQWSMSAPTVGVLTAAIALSVSAGYGFDVGQMSLFTTLMILVALIAQHRERPAFAGSGLALATVKAGTMLPFLLLFYRRKDRAAWVMLALGCVVLACTVNPLVEVPSRIWGCLSNIAYQSKHMNDFIHPVNADMMALDRAIYYLGVSDRDLVRLIQGTIVLALGGWVGWQVVRRPEMPEAAKVSLVAFFATLFLYHRLYDMLILVLPLVYAFGRAQVAQGRARWLYITSTLAVLGVLYLRLETVKALGWQPRGPDLLHLVLQGVVVPYGVWLTLIGMASLAAAECCGVAGPRPSESKESLCFEQRAVVVSAPDRLAYHRAASSSEETP